MGLENPENDQEKKKESIKWPIKREKTYKRAGNKKGPHKMEEREKLPSKGKKGKNKFDIRYMLSSQLVRKLGLTKAK